MVMLHSPEHARQRGWAGKTKLGKAANMASNERTPQLPRFGSDQHPLSLNLGIHPRLPASESLHRIAPGRFSLR